MATADVNGVELYDDCRGQGRSSKPDQPYAPTLHAADLAVLCDAAGLGSAIVGHSPNIEAADRVAALLADLWRG